MAADGRLHHSWRVGRRRHAAILDDYANMARAALALFEATGAARYLDQAEAWVDVANRRYWDDEGGGYFLTADDTRDVITRPKTIADNAVPPGNGTMIEVLARLFHLIGDPRYRDRADRLVRVFSGAEPAHRTNLPTLCNGFELLEAAVQIVVVGDAGDPRTLGLVRAAVEAAPPTRVLLRAEAELPPQHPAHGKRPVDGAPAAYICKDSTCGLPVTDARALRDQLAGR
jgi:uncharacterized protein YyaL (SSP411 family)